MAQIIYLEGYQSPLWQELSFIEPQNKHIVSKIKQSFGKIVWFEYMQIIISVAQKWKNIIWKDNIENENLPFHISHHLWLVTNDRERDELVKLIWNILKTQIKKDLKEQLFYLRTRILQTNNPQ